MKSLRFGFGLLLLGILANPFSTSLVRGETGLAPGSVADAHTAEEVSDYIRYTKAESGSEMLQTAITRFTKGGANVDLVSVVHLGDKVYFDNLNTYLQQYEAVLYELVGGEFQAEDHAGADSLVPGEMGSVRQLQQMATSFLGLAFQLEEIDYSAPNFVHADVTWEQYQELMVAKNQSFATIFSRAMELSGEGGIPGLPQGEAAMGLMLGNMLSALTTGDTDGLKRSLAPMLGEAEGLITELEGEDGTVLVSERNKVVMTKLEEVVRENGAGDYAIFYGAGHMPDLEARLLAEGYEKGPSGWMDAWTMSGGIESGATDEKPGSAPTPNPLEALSGLGITPENLGDEVPDPSGLLLDMFENNPELIGAFQQLGEVIEQLQGAE